jgi:RimJ/RimL family protein N-acetyltransferase
MTTVLRTERLELVPITLPIFEAVYRADRLAAESLSGARFPSVWPGKQLIEQAFSASLPSIRADPAQRLWGDRLVILPSDEYGDRRVIGSVVFHGYPAGGPHGRGLPAGIAEVGYGIEAQYQRQGIATEATGAAVQWALGQDGVHAVQAVTFSLNKASRRVLEKLGMQIVGTEEHDFLGELLVYELRRS